VKQEAKRATVISGLILQRAITSSAKKLENVLDKWITIIQ
jgi:hypothetical protein